MCILHMDISPTGFKLVDDCIFYSLHLLPVLLTSMFLIENYI